MAPIRHNTNGPDKGDNCEGIKCDRRMRKPLVEKRRRARINESLQELRVLISDADLPLQSKMENAEVLEMTVKRVGSILQNRLQEVDAVNREASERFAAGYIQCMHDVHTFVSGCPGIEPSVAAELLNHLLESMPLNDEERLQMMLPETVASHPGSISTWSPPESMCMGLVSPALSSSFSSTDDLYSDLDETDSEQSQGSSSEEADSHDTVPSMTDSKSVWRPW
ncbi:hypothetical protein Q5P01_022485 [Channa striata]|uniref:Transcription cofactor HES-6 n=1 Tax=Channa striata TaxID=64152 RepID=A0AA88LRD6_CHASR|nr:hypothetical protein Q5P01_022485 [Channa striata]